MTTKQMREFFQEKKAKAGPEDVNWEARKAAWIQAIEDLYKIITEQYLAQPIADGTVKVSREEQRIVEHNIGVYIAPVLVLSVGDETVVFSPKGMNVVGATGRIDLRGDVDDRTIVRQPGDRWSVVETRMPTLKLIPLNEKSLLAALKSIMRR
jgi:hypothetical protein